MLSSQQIQSFHDNGFVLNGKVLTDEQIGVLRDEVLRVIRDKDNSAVKQPVMLHNMGKPDAAVWQIVNIYEASEPFRQLISNPAILKSMVTLTGAKELRIWHDQIQYKPASMGGVNMWHQDAPYWPILRPMTQVTAWVALDDVAEDNGCMSMVPGSHKWGNTIDFLHTIKEYEAMPKEYQGRPIEVRRCPVKAGEVHFHHALTWHGSHANKSGRPRRAIALHYITDETRYVAAGMHVMKKFVEVSDGEVLKGSHFPLVWSAKG
jgi:ectoine hydroxylase-related dioxygenase (phytanoyl-CoA dioxygenase family)